LNTIIYLTIFRSVEVDAAAVFARSRPISIVDSGLVDSRDDLCLLWAADALYSDAIAWPS